MYIVANTKHFLRDHAHIVNQGIKRHSYKASRFVVPNKKHVPGVHIDLHFFPYQATQAVMSQKLVNLKDLFNIIERIIPRHDMQMTPEQKLSIYVFTSLP